MTLLRGHDAEFEALVDRCAEDVASGRSTVADCLRRWPEHADALRPLLEAVDALQRTAPPDASSDPFSRARFMAALEATPQQSPGRLVRPRMPAVPSIPPWRAPDWWRLAGLSRLAMVVAPAAVIALVALLAVWVQGGPSTAQASTLTVFAGEVARQDGGAWAVVGDGTRLREGDHVRAGPEAQALITFPDGSTVGLEPGSELVIERASSDGARVVALRQIAGRLWNQVAHDGRDGASYTVQTADALVTGEETAFETVIEDGETLVSTQQGSVQVQAGGERTAVAAGERVRAYAQTVVLAERARAIAAEAAAASESTLTLRIEAPFLATLVAPGGKATGVRPDGAVYQQITGGVTSSPADGPQQISVTAPPAGDYLLLLRRISEGEGSIEGHVLVTIDGREHLVELDDVARTGTQADGMLALRLLVERDNDGATEVRAQRLGGGAEPSAVVEEKVVLPAAAKQRAARLVEAIARRQAERRSSRDNAVKPLEAKPSDAAPSKPTAARDDEERQQEDERAKQQEERRGGSGVRAATATATATPRTTPTATSAPTRTSTPPAPPRVIPRQLPRVIPSLPGLAPPDGATDDNPRDDGDGRTDRRD